MSTFVIRNRYWDETISSPFEQLKSFVELEVATIGPHTFSCLIKNIGHMRHTLIKHHTRFYNVSCWRAKFDLLTFSVTQYTYGPVTREIFGA